ncbi:hypothetical protein [Streptomyces minutiscleroticus]|uniref:hypothetical protein n=1 Tax=Streptomyces minutiscleroticus TaxID=68238 RepID=UPI0033338C50
MSTREPDSGGGGDGGRPGEGVRGPVTPDDVWRMFIEDSEPAIRTSAPREPSARERALGIPVEPSRARVTEHTVRRAPRGYDEPDAPQNEAVGELWRPRTPTAAPAWRDLDGAGRYRRVGRTLMAAAAVVGLVLLVSEAPQPPAGTRQEDGRAPGSLLQEPENAPTGVPTAPGDLVATPPKDTPTTLHPG